MSGVDGVVLWIFALPFVALSFFIYGIVEEAIQKRLGTCKNHKPQYFLPPYLQVESMFPLPLWLSVIL